MCPLCLRFGELRFPCQREPNVEPIRCEQCHFVFPNNDCWMAHRRNVDPLPPGCQDGRRGRLYRPLCEERRFCRLCGNLIYRRFGPHQCRRINNRNNHIFVDGGGGLAGQIARLDQQQQNPEPQPVPLPHQHQQQQQQIHHQTNNNNFEIPPPPPPSCEKCKGPHPPNDPCFIQPRGFWKCLQLGAGINFLILFF